MSEQETIVQIKSYISGKKRGNADKPYEVEFENGEESFKIIDVKQIPDFSIIEKEYLPFSEFIRFHISIDGVKTKTGFLMELKQPVQIPQLQQMRNPSSGDNSGIAELHKMQMDLIKGMLEQSNAANRQTLENTMAAMTGVIAEVKKSSESTTKQLIESVESRIEHARTMAREENKFEIERLKLQYDTGKVDWMELIGAAKDLLPDAIDFITAYKTKPVN